MAEVSMLKPSVLVVFLTSSGVLAWPLHAAPESGCALMCFVHSFALGGWLLEWGRGWWLGEGVGGRHVS
jgi:hypothetical protein